METEEIIMDKIEVDLGKNRIMGEEILEEMQEHTKI